MQNLEPILIFITVAEMGSFTHAADSLGIQKGRASTAVRKLEEDVGVRLLHRTTRSVQLTEDGRVFHARARDLLAEVDDLHSMFASDRVALRGRLRVDLPSELARTTFVPALPAFMATYPELELEVSSTDRQVDLVQEGFDCVLRLGPIGDETLIARPLGLLRMANAASPAYLARYGVPRSLEDLQRQEHRTIHFSTMLGARPYGWEYPDGDSYATLQLPGALHVNSAQTYEAAALAGLGLISGATLGDWPILREWSACGDHTRFSSPGARRVPRRSTSEQSVAPSPRIHEMGRRCGDAVSGIARRTSSSGDSGDFGRPSCQQRCDPGPILGAVDLGIANDGECTGHEQAAQIAIPLFADTAEPIPTPARVLFGNQPDPGREVATRSEGFRIGDARDKGSG